MKVKNMTESLHGCQSDKRRERDYKDLQRASGSSAVETSDHPPQIVAQRKLSVLLTGLLWENGVNTVFQTCLDENLGLESRDWVLVTAKNRKKALSLKHRAEDNISMKSSSVRRPGYESARQQAAKRTLFSDVLNAAVYLRDGVSGCRIPTLRYNDCCPLRCVSGSQSLVPDPKSSRRKPLEPAFLGGQG
ncbi:hypothetical protein EK21DRAFT_117870 [Setomelanomma holmii]|uniref:Uncharacterized protein n=1 Tax=Setomelanomma holmii TaxID=210430 RepID=A0A9P4GZC3_9PLEO|nr:hypothetical protein EK21DRAFT_117870 [Setomelanomma holmii]